jgi:predicted MFS family arabinose efflux permease
VSIIEFFEKQRLSRYRVPISTSFGRRPVLLFSSLICMGSCIWRARAQTYGSFMGACVLNGIGAGSVISPSFITISSH